MKQKKIPVGILGATGMVGQRFAELLAHHPWFELKLLAASERSSGKNYGDAIKGTPLFHLPPETMAMPVTLCRPEGISCKVLFSGLDSSIAGEMEEAFAKAGHIVISNASNHRMDKTVPLLIPEINPDHLELIPYQGYPNGGCIVTNPNCSAIGITMSLKPLADLFGIEEVYAVTMQAVSGAGYPGVASIDIIDNVIPYIGGEEPKVESEPGKILGAFQKGKIEPYPMRVHATCTRVAVSDGHMACMMVRLQKKAKASEMIDVWRNFQGEPGKLGLPSAPDPVFYYLEGEKYPQPKWHRDLGKGMAVSIGRLREISPTEWKFVVLSHNTVRGAAGCALLNAELMLKKGYLQHA